MVVNVYGRNTKGVNGRYIYKSWLRQTLWVWHLKELTMSFQNAFSELAGSVAEIQSFKEMAIFDILVQNVARSTTFLAKLSFFIESYMNISASFWANLKSALNPIVSSFRCRKTKMEAQHFWLSRAAQKCLLLNRPCDTSFERTHWADLPDTDLPKMATRLLNGTPFIRFEDKKFRPPRLVNANI